MFQGNDGPIKVTLQVNQIPSTSSRMSKHVSSNRLGDMDILAFKYYGITDTRSFVDSLTGIRAIGSRHKKLFPKSQHINASRMCSR